MSVFPLTGPRGRKVLFETFTPQHEFKGGEVARRPIPARTLSMIRRLKDENPGVRVLVSYEMVEVPYLTSQRGMLGTEVVAERGDQIAIGLDMPLEIFRGRLKYLINGHHRAVAAYEKGIELHSAYVINTDQPTLTEAEDFDPLSEKVLVCPSVWKLRTYQYPGLEPIADRLVDFRKKLCRLRGELGSRISSIPTDPATKKMRDLTIQLLAGDNLEETVGKFGFYFGLNISDLQLVCLLRDQARLNWLRDRLSRMPGSNPDARLQKKIEGFQAFGLVVTAMLSQRN